MTIMRRPSPFGELLSLRQAPINGQTNGQSTTTEGDQPEGLEA
jgi:hypothetical protein